MVAVRIRPLRNDEPQRALYAVNKKVPNPLLPTTTILDHQPNSYFLKYAMISPRGSRASDPNQKCNCSAAAFVFSKHLHNY
jgi:hypothetical protein